MIFTVTLNPSIDLFYTLSCGVQPGAILRADTQTLRPGGKGVNTAIVLHRLGVPVKATGFLAGKVGKLYLEFLQNCCDSDFVFLPAGETRINAKLEGAPETAVNAPGPELPESALQTLTEKLGSLSQNDTLILSGSGSAEAYRTLGAYANLRGARLVIDTSGEALLESLSLHPWLIKPNKEELEALLSCSLNNAEKIRPAMEQAQELGAENILLSLGAEGAALLTKEGQFYRAAAEGPFQVRSTVGAGDSLTAGFLAAKVQEKNDAEALQFAVAAGTAAVCSPWLPEKAEICEMLSIAVLNLDI